MIAKDFHSAKDFRQIRGKSFVIMVGVMASARLFGHTRQDRGRGGTTNA
jgi:hypothetical protein